jgi:hypothetical protein
MATTGDKTWQEIQEDIEKKLVIVDEQSNSIEEKPGSVEEEPAPLDEKPLEEVSPGIQVWDTGNSLYSARITFDPRGETKGRGKYTVDFSAHHFNPNWVWCPNPRCGKKLMQNRTLRGSFETVCHDCKAKIVFIF